MCLPSNLFKGDMMIHVNGSGKFLAEALLDDASRPVLHENAAMVTLKDGSPVLCTTDGHRLHMVSEHMIPDECKVGDVYKVHVTKTDVMLETVKNVRYPDVTAIVPEGGTWVRLVGVPSLSASTVKALWKANLVAYLHVNRDGHVQFIGFVPLTVFDRSEGGILINPIFLLGSTREMGGEEKECRYYGPLCPIMIAGAGKRALIMPLHVKESLTAGWSVRHAEIEPATV